MITKRAKYAIKAMLHLARHEGLGPVHAQTIATEEQIPRRFLEMILLQLRNGGLIRSRPGHGGGHQLKRTPDDISLLSVICAIHERVEPLPCLSTASYERCLDCEDESSCATRHLFITIQKTQSTLLSQSTLASVMQRRRATASPPCPRSGPKRTVMHRATTTLSVITQNTTPPSHHLP